jgi:hypothetical protein
MGRQVRTVEAATWLPGVRLREDLPIERRNQASRFTFLYGRRFNRRCSTSEPSLGRPQALILNLSRASAKSLLASWRWLVKQSGDDISIPQPGVHIAFFIARASADRLFSAVSSRSFTSRDILARLPEVSLDRSGFSQSLLSLGAFQPLFAASSSRLPAPQISRILLTPIRG